MNFKFLPFLLLFTFEGFAQRIIKMEGTIVDSLSNLPISGVAVSTVANNKIYGQISDQSGRFALFLPAGEHIISFKSQGYVPQWRYLNEKSPDQTLTVYFQKVEYQLEQVIVSTKGYDENIRKPLLGVNQIDIKTLSKIPAAFGELDFLRGIQMLPGVSSVGEASNGVNIRGGTTDQNLILVDNTPIFNPTHMIGLFSVIPPASPTLNRTSA